MPRKNTKAAKGGGSIRQRKDGLWEGRYTVGRDPGTGKQVRKSVYGQTQQEARKKLAQAVAAIDRGDYVEPQKMTVGAWLDTWAASYLGNVKPNTLYNYQGCIENNLKPAFGAVKLDSLQPHMVQSFYNGLSLERDGRPGLSRSSVQLIHTVLHRALKQAVKLGYIHSNPADLCTLPRKERKEKTPIDGEAVGAFLEAIKGHRFETLYTVALFTGMREGELLGLLWDCVDFERGTIRIDKQLLRMKERGTDHPLILASTKSGKARTITPAPLVMELLKKHWRQQAENRLRVGRAWINKGGVFADELGNFIPHSVVYQEFKKVSASIGMPSATFHDLRHSYAVAAIRAGDDIKTVQGNLGHATASFTLDVYGHVTEAMKQESAARMEAYITGTLGL